MKLKTFTGYSKCGGIEYTFKLPITRIVCPKCRGNGTHVNPSVDGHGLTAEDFADDPDFAESYFSGVFDVVCKRCDGLRVVDEIDQDACFTRLSWWKGMIRYYDKIQMQRESWSESYYERMAGA